MFTREVPKASVAGAILVAGATPVPLIGVFITGLTRSLLEMLRAALRAPVALGVNVRLMVQDPPAAKGDVQLFVCA